MRLLHLTEQKERGENPYPHKFHVDLSLRDYIDRYERLKNDELLDDVAVRVSGRLMSKRENSSKLFFYDLHAAGHTLQLMANARLDVQLTSHSVNALRSRNLRSLNAKFAQCSAL